jgi:hypothetical protein
MFEPLCAGDGDLLRNHGEPLGIGPCRLIPTANAPEPQIERVARSGPEKFRLKNQIVM